MNIIAPRGRSVDALWHALSDIKTSQQTARSLVPGITWLLFCSALLPRLAAQTSVWVGPDSGVWTLDANWMPAAPNGNDAVASFGTQSPTISGQITLDQNVTLATLTLENGRTLLLQGPGLLEFSGNGARAIAVRDPFSRLVIDALIQTSNVVPLIVDVDADAALQLNATLAIDAAPVVKTGQGTLQLQGDNESWTGPLRVESGSVYVPVSGALGGGVPTAANGTSLMPGSQLRIAAGGGVGNEWLSLNDAMVHFDESSTPELKTTVHLIGQNRLTSASSNSLTTAGVWSGPGGITYSQLNPTVQLSHSGDYLGPTLIEQTEAAVYDATAFGSPQEGTYLSGSRVSLVHAGPSDEPFHVDATSSLFIDVDSLTGAVTLAGGELELGSIFGRTVQFQGPVEIIGSATVRSRRYAMRLEGGVDGDGELRIRSSGDVEFRSQVGPAVDLAIESTVTLFHPQDFAQSILLDGGQLHAEADVRFLDLDILPARGEISSSSTARIAIADFDPRNARINANLDLDGPLVVRSLMGPTLANVGRDFAEDIVIQHGRVVVAGSQGLGDDRGITRLAEGTSASIVVQEGLQLSETIELNNSRGIAGAGALIADSRNGGTTVLTGTLDLGSREAFLGSGNQAAVLLELRGPVTGGDLVQLIGYLTLGSDQATYTGKTIVAGGHLRLADEGKLEHTAGIVLDHRFANLVIDNSQLARDDRIADTIPITLRGGHLQIMGPEGQIQGERLGKVTLERGDSLISTGTSGLGQLTIQSLDRHPGATVNLAARIAEGLRLEQPPALEQGIIGGWARWGGSGFASLRGDTIVPFESSQKPLSAAAEGDHIFLFDSETLTRDLTLGSLISLSPIDIDLSGHVLNVATGGVILDGPRILNGRLTSVGGELYLYDRGAIQADIVDDGDTPLDVVVAGDGEITLSGRNTFSGTTTVNGSATLVAEVEGAIPAGSDVVLDGGTLRIEDMFMLGSVTIRGGGVLTSGDQAARFTAERLDVESGSLGTLLYGETPIHKTGRGTFRMTRDLRDFRGAIQIDEGTVWIDGARAGGSGNIIVHPDGILAVSESMSNSVVLDGGSLWGGDDTKQPRIGAIEVRADSRIVLQDVSTPTAGSSVDMQIGTLTGSGNLRVEGPGGSLKLSGNSPDYHGTLNVLSGDLELAVPDALGQGRVVMAPHSRLLITSTQPVRADVDLDTVTLLTDRPDRVVDFLGRMRMKGQNLVFRDSLRILAEVTIADDASLVAHNRAAIELAGPLEVEGNASLHAHSATQRTSDATLSINGLIRSRAASATLDLGGSSDLLTLGAAAIEVPGGTSLQILRQGEAFALEIGTHGLILTGDGSVRQSVVLESSGTLSPGDEVGRLTIDGDLHLVAGAIEWELQSAGGDPMSGPRDRIDVKGLLTVDADDSAPIIVRPLPVDATGEPAFLSDFDARANYSWSILSATQWQPFPLDRFVVDRSALLAMHSLSQFGAFSVDVQDNRLWLHFTGKSDLGDFNQDGALGVADVDQLMAAIASGQFVARLDLNLDNVLDQADLSLWVDELRRTYFGDANLDGAFTSSDLVQVLAAGGYEDSVPSNSTWATGDWNADLEFSSSDLVAAFQAGGYETGPRSGGRAAPSVPEPTRIAPVIMLTAIYLRRRRTTGYRR